MSELGPRPDIEQMGEPEPRPDEEVFDLLQAADHELVKKYQPKFLARGGEHIVYDIPGHPDVVAKVEVESIKSPNFISPDDTEKIDELLAQKRTRFLKMKSIFGANHVLAERVFFMKVPVTDSVRKWVFEGRVPDTIKTDDVKETWAIVKIQHRALELQNQERSGIVGSYVEYRDPNLDAYRRITSALLEEDASAVFTREEFADLAGSPLKELLEKADTDPLLTETLKDFVVKTIIYTKETGEMLDCAGFDNVPVWQEKDGTWNYRLVDALYPGYQAEKKIDFARKALEMASRGEKLDDEHFFPLLNMVNFTRLINGLAERLGIVERISFVPDELKGKIDYWKVLRND